MTQILTMKYTKEEERIVVISNILGIFVGIPLGLLLGYFLGFYTDIRSAAFSSIGWAMLILKTGATTLPLSWIATVAICLKLFKKKNEIRSAEKIRKIIPGTLLLPLALTSGFVVLALIIFPLCFLVLDYINRPITAMIIGALALLPFMIFIGALLLPETPAGKALRRYIHRTKRSLPK
jgi:MFS family permease